MKNLKTFEEFDRSNFLKQLDEEDMETPIRERDIKSIKKFEEFDFDEYEDDEDFNFPTLDIGVHPISGVHGTTRFANLDDDDKDFLKNEYQNNPKIKNWFEEGRIGVSGNELWVIDNDKPVIRYFKKLFGR